MKFLKMWITRILPVVAVALAGTVYAGQESRGIPLDRNGVSAHNANLTGCKVVTSTGSTTSEVVFSGAGLLYGIEMSTGPTTVDNFVVVRDSATVNTANTTWLIPPIVGVAAGSLTQFNVPIRFSNGLQYQVGLASTTVSVFYTKDAD